MIKLRHLRHLRHLEPLMHIARRWLIGTGVANVANVANLETRATPRTQLARRPTPSHPRSPRIGRHRRHRELQNRDLTYLLIAAKLKELRTMTPPDTCVRIDQRFTISPQVALVLKNFALDDMNTPVNHLRGESAGADYERMRARILAQAAAEEAAAA